MPNKYQLIIAQSEILQGYSEVVVNGNRLYIKHADNTISNLSSLEHQKALERATNMGVATEKERIDDLVKNGIWSKEKEKQTADLKFILSTLKTNREKEMLPSRKAQYQSEIEKKILEINTLLAEKIELLGLTAESYAMQKLNEFIVINSFYKDTSLKTKYIIDEDDEIKDLYDLVGAYSRLSLTLNEESIKYIACSTSFLNFFMLSTSAFEFYGVPIKNLTVYQIDLYYRGNYYKSILENMSDRIPEAIREDPVKLVEFFENRKTGEKLEQQFKEGENVSLVGATAEDLQKLGLQDNTPELVKKIREKGKSLSMAEYMELTK